MTYKYTIEDMRNWAAKKGGQCLSEEYKGTHRKLEWKCKNDHIWSTMPDKILIGQWCPYCIGKNRNIKDMQKLAISKGGECLSNKYMGSAIKLKWKCKEGHEWENTPGHISHGQWCSVCSQGVSERICNKFFEEIFNDKFPKKRYSWLLSPKGEKLELDGYNEKLKLAFEYCGRQHYDLKGFVKNQKDLDYLKRCDQIKKDRCKEKGITLIEVPYTVKYDDMEKYILEKVDSNILFRKLNYKEWDIYSTDKIRKVQDIAELNGGKCLSSVYINNKSKLLWSCAKNHQWIAIPNNIQRNHWCPHCNYRGRSKNV